MTHKKLIFHKIPTAPEQERLILKAFQPIKGYFMSRSEGISFIVFIFTFLCSRFFFFELPDEVKYDTRNTDLVFPL